MNEDPVRPRVLVVEDEPAARLLLARRLSADHEVESAGCAETAALMLRRFRPHVLLTDLRLPGESGLSLIQRAHQELPDCILLIMTAYSSIPIAVDAMRAGARDFLMKPINLDALELVIRRELEHANITMEVRRLREVLREGVRDEEVWGESGVMQALLRSATDVASSSATVLITGESGTGKEVMARFLHRRSRRAAAPFVAVNCGAIPDTLLESEFFGHERGAFTGAVGRRIGHFERANGGTIFLDEVGELSPVLQVKLLRVLQERQLHRVGGAESVELDVRVIAATNQDIEKMIRTGRLREDLYYRLNVIQLEMPPLRERRSDISLLWSRLLQRHADREGRPVPETTAEAMQALHAYDWPGNVRELENVAERALVLSRDQPIQPGHLPASVRTQAAALESTTLRIPGSTLEEIEKTAILRTLEAVGGSSVRAAKMLGISPRKIQYRLRAWRERGHEEPGPAGVMAGEDSEARDRDDASVEPAPR